jgi:5-formyltetrahydrofolate cyclo-ligase
MLKTEVRQIYRDYTDSLTCSQVKYLSSKISNSIINDFILDEISTVYIDTQNDKELFNSWNIIDYIIENRPDITLVTPYLVDNEYKLFKITSTTCYYRENGCFNPIEAEEYDGDHIDFIFINVQCFDKKGYFIHSDKINLDNYQALKLIGMSFFEPVYKIQDIFINERKLDACIIPNEYYEFNPASN